MATPSMAVLNIGSAFRRASTLRQSYRFCQYSTSARSLVQQ